MTFPRVDCLGYPSKKPQATPYPESRLKMGESPHVETGCAPQPEQDKSPAKGRCFPMAHCFHE